MSPATVGIVDYGMGNRRSVEKALERVGARAVVTADHEALLAADGLIVPGVGAFPAAMASLRALGLDDLVVRRAQAGTNAHHLIEAAFKAFARALRVAVSIDPRETGVPSTKGTL